MPPPFAIVAALPWLLLAVLTPLLLRRRPRIDEYEPVTAADAPLVSIIVPARNEADNIGPCLSTLLASDYPRKEIVVVDDGSVDGTADIARILEERGAGKLRVVESGSLPDGWIGKPWACWRGYNEARGELLLFTDADTRHDDDLLGHAVAAMEASGADLVSVLPRQIMGSFWERVVLPHIFALIYLRYRDLRRVNHTRSPRDVIANGQFLLFRRDAYEAIGGHESVRADVVEDLRLAQRTVAAGRRIFIAHAENRMETRMYRSLSGILEGWTKNLAAGARQSVDPWLRPALPWLLAFTLAAFWAGPPVALAAALAGLAPTAIFDWSLTATAFSLVFWLMAHRRFRTPLLHAFLYPLGALCAAAIVARSALRGGHIEWRGRRYDLATPVTPVAGRDARKA